MKPPKSQPQTITGNMKTFTISVLIVASLALTGCVTVHEGDQPKPPTTQKTPKPGPETVLVTYHVQLGREAQLQSVLERAWKAYRSQSMVMARPHVIVREADGLGQSRFVEVLTWVKPPDNPSADVRAIWQEEQALCEARNGRTGIEGGPVELIAGK